MHWKMSIDLTRALVPSMGQHDPLDGYISNLQLRTTAAALPQPAAGPNLEDETRQYATMLKRGELATADPVTAEFNGRGFAEAKMLGASWWFVLNKAARRVSNSARTRVWR